MKMKICIVLVSLLALATAAEAATVRGRLEQKDRSGARIPAGGIPVTALAANKVRSHPASTGQDGMYYLYNVPAGAYYLEIWINGMNNRPLYYQIKVFE